MNADGVGLVLLRLSNAGCDPEPLGIGTWTACCPAHGGKYRALVVSRYADGSVSLRCRYVGPQGESCPEAAIWESLGLRPERLERGLAATAPAEGAREATPQPASGGDCRPDLAVGDPAAEQGEGPSATDPDTANAPKHSARTGAAAGERAGRDDGSLSQAFTRIARRVRVIRGLDGRFYGQVPVASHQEVHELRSLSFQYWLIARYRRRRKALPNRDRLNMLIRALEADATALEAAEPVWVRVADGTRHGLVESWNKSDGCSDDSGPTGPDIADVYYLDLGDSSWQSVEIRADGCRIVDQPPVLFRRPHGFGPLPRPQWDGSLDLLKKYTNIDREDFPLLVAWMTAALRPAGPYPILILTGEQGSAKSTMARIARRLIDPGPASLKALPTSQRDFMIQAHNSWVLTYDNVSSLSNGLSDSFCRTATGGSFSTRSLYSNDDETLFDAERPVIVTGIDDFVHRSDLIDRCVLLHLPAIADEARRRERNFWSEFHADRRRLVGTLLMAVAGGLKMLPQVELAASPRMADFAQWGEAVIRGLGWEPGSFLDRYHHNRRAACDSALEDSEVAQSLRGMMDATEGPWRGTASELLQALAGYTRQGATTRAQWPKTPRLLSCVLRRIAPQLRTIGMAVNFDRIDNSRMITISLSATSTR